MKKYLFSFTLLLLVTMAAQAQLEIGLKGGFNNAKVKEDGFTDTLGFSLKTKGQMSGQYGLVLGYKINDQMAVQADVLYSSFSSKASGGNQLIDVKVGVKQAFVQVPVMFRYSFTKGKVRPYIAAGPGFSYLTKATANVNASVLSFYNFSQKVDYADSNWKDINRLEISGNISAGVICDIGPGSVTADFRYMYGFTDIDKTSSTLQNRTWFFSVGYMINTASFKKAAKPKAVKTVRAYDFYTLR